eukprot:3490301-Rhodomonas_salina.1
MDLGQRKALACVLGSLLSPVSSALFNYLLGLGFPFRARGDTVWVCDLAHRAKMDLLWAGFQ